MRNQKKRSIPLLLLSLISFGALGYLIKTYPPSTTLTIENVSFVILIPFFLSLFLFLFTLIAFATKATHHGFFTALFVIAFLLLRLNHLTNLFFIVLLIVLFILFELLFRKQ